MNNLWQKPLRIPASIEQNSLFIFRIDLTDYIEDINVKTIVHTLSIEEIARMNSFKYDNHRNIFATARYSTRLICSELLNVNVTDLKIQLSAYGKPYFKDYQHLQFSISHSGNFILIGFGMYFPLGIDIEIVNPNIDHLNLSKSVFSIREITSLQKLTGKKLIEGFYNIWTQKESYIKAKGLGLHMSLDSFSVNLNNVEKYNLLEAAEGQQETKKWQVFNFQTTSDYTAACACDHSIRSFVYFDITDQICKRPSLN